MKCKMKLAHFEGPSRKMKACMVNAYCIAGTQVKMANKEKFTIHGHSFISQFRFWNKKIGKLINLIVLYLSLKTLINSPFFL